MAVKDWLFDNPDLVVREAKSQKDEDLPFPFSSIPSLLLSFLPILSSHFLHLPK